MMIIFLECCIFGGVFVSGKTAMRILYCDLSWHYILNFIQVQQNFSLVFACDIYNVLFFQQRVINGCMLSFIIFNIFFQNSSLNTGLKSLILLEKIFVACSCLRITTGRKFKLTVKGLLRAIKLFDFLLYMTPCRACKREQRIYFVFSCLYLYSLYSASR